MSDSWLEKIILGTVQFGLDYGSGEINKMPSNLEINQILDKALANGINIIDTAPSYGNSENKIGFFNKREELSIITKYSNNHKNINFTDIKKSLICSLENLRLSKVDCLLFHNAESFLQKGKEEINSLAYELKKEGLIKKIGISVYTPQEALNSLDKGIDVIQIPFNILDGRWEQRGVLKKLKGNKIEIHARSVFLQGLLLNEPKLVPLKFQKWNYIFSAFSKWCNENQLSRLDGALNYVLSNKDIDKVLIGVNSLSQLSQILRMKSRKRFTLPEFRVCDENLLNPSKWSSI